MNIKEISVTYGGKLNLGDYNSAHIEMTASAVLDNFDEPEKARAELLAFVTEAVQQRARELFAKRGARVDEIFAGLPVEAQEQIKEQSNGD